MTLSSKAESDFVNMFSIMLRSFSVFSGRRCSFFLYSFLTAIWLSHSQLLGHIEGQPHSRDVNHCVSAISTQRSPRALLRGWVPKPSQVPSRIWTGNPLILIATPSKPKCVLILFVWYRHQKKSAQIIFLQHFWEVVLVLLVLFSK